MFVIGASMDQRASQKSTNSNICSHFKESEVRVMVFNATFNNLSHFKEILTKFDHRDGITFYQEFRYDGFSIYKGRW